MLLGWGRQPGRPHLVLLVEGHAGSPAYSPHVCSGHLEDIQLKRLLQKHHVVLRDSKAVVVAGREQRAGGDGAENFCVLHGALPFLLVAWRRAKLEISPPLDSTITHTETVFSEVQ